MRIPNPSLGVWHWEGEPLEHSALKAFGSRDSLRISVRPSHQTYLQVLEGLLGKHGASVACMGAGHCKQRSQGIVTSMCSPGVSHFGNTWAHPSGLRSPRPNNKWGGNTAQPISTVCLQFSQAHTAASSHAETNPTHQWAGPSPSHQEFCSTPPSQLHPQGGRHQKQERLQPCTL